MTTAYRHAAQLPLTAHPTLKKRPTASQAGWRWLGCVLALCWLGPTPAAAPLRVGVAVAPTPLPPGGFRVFTDEGLEIPLAQALGRALGRDVVLQAVPPAAAAAALAEGSLDVYFARTAPQQPTPAGVQSLTTGYRSGLTVAMRADTDITRWEQLRGRTLCASLAQPQAEAVAARYGATLQREATPAHALIAVRTGACDATLHDSAVLQPLQALPAWASFTATLPSQDSQVLQLWVADARPVLQHQTRTALRALRQAQTVAQLKQQWVQHVAVEVYLEQDAPDCH